MMKHLLKTIHEPIYNPTLINDNNSLLEAAGYDPTRLAEVDADAAYALQLTTRRIYKRKFNAKSTSISSISSRTR